MSTAADTPSRDDLRRRLAAFRTELERADDQIKRWNDGYDAVVADVGDVDREWLNDRLWDLSAEFGLPDYAASAMRSARAHGLDSPDDALDSEGEQGPLPFFGYLPVRLTRAAHGSIDDALRSFAAGGGHGTWTWGCDVPEFPEMPFEHRVWFSDALAGADAEHVDAGIVLLRADLAAAGLELVLATE